MKKRVVFIFTLLITMPFYAKKNKIKPVKFYYPITEKVPHIDSYFGENVEDNYQWLEDDTATNTANWVKAQNKVTQNYLDQIPYRNQLKERFKELFDFSKLSAPIISGNYVFFTKKEGLQNQAVIYVQKGLKGNAEVFLNPNELDAKGLTTYTITAISKDNKYANVVVNKAGSDWSEMYIYDIATKTKLADKLEWIKFSGASFYKDGFFYSRYEKPAIGKELSAKNEYHSVYYHKIGDEQTKDELVYKDANEPLSYNAVEVSEDENYLILNRSLGTYGNEIYYTKTNEIGYNFKPLFTGNKGEYVVVDVINDKFLVFTDDGASNKQLVLVDLNNKDSKNWKKIIAEQKDAVLEGVYTSGGKLFAKYLQNATNKLFVYNIDGSAKKEIALPGTGNVDFYASSKNDRTVAYAYTSFNYPNSIFTYDINTGYSSLFLKPTLKFNPDDYESKQVWYKSKDGTKVSMFIVHKKGLPLDGNHPTYLYGYGGFSINMTPSFSASRILLLENGVVFAMPNLRGGAEYGEDWHKAGMLMNKQTVFNDFIAAAEYLIKNKYTSKNKLAIAGGSNGGLLVGACMVQRPDLFKVALPAVGVLDMLKFHQFTIGWGWVPEYGSSTQSKEMFSYLKGYSPLHNLKLNAKYPATLITTGDHDDRVVPAHSFKFAAKLQEVNNGENPTFIRIETNAGHGAGKPTSKIIDEIADTWSFFLWNVGIKTLK